MTVQLRAAIIRDPVAAERDEAYPWDYTVDYCIPGTTIRNTKVDSYDYGRVATHADAIAAVCWALKQAAGED